MNTGTIKAIDYMNYYMSPSIKKRYEQAKTGELVCRIEASQGSEGFPALTAEQVIARMDDAGVDKVFLVAWTMFSYWSQKVLLETRVEEIAEVTQRHPDRFVGLAGYNPFRIMDSLRLIEKGVREYGFKGVYVHIYGFDIPLNDPKMYPLYAKCQEMDIPVSLQVGYVLEAMPSDTGRPIYLDRIALDFPKLKVIGSHTGYPWCEELISICYKFDNVYFGVDAHMPRYLEPNVINYIKSRGKDKVIWGSNGIPWKPMLKQIDEMGFSDEVKAKLLRDNATKVFKL